MHTDGDKLMTLVTSMGFSIKESIILKVYIKDKFQIYYYISCDKIFKTRLHSLHLPMFASKIYIAYFSNMKQSISTTRNKYMANKLIIFYEQKKLNMAHKLLCTTDKRLNIMNIWCRQIIEIENHE